MLGQKKIRGLLQYDAETGEFFWRLTGKPAGTIHHTGYRHIRIEGRKYQASHLAWVYVYGRWPKCQIDHRDNLRSNDRIENLREADHSQNGANKRTYKNNACGIKGVHLFKSKTIKATRWRAQIKKSGRVMHLGLFATQEQAADAYRDAALRLHGEFAQFSAPPSAT